MEDQTSMVTRSPTGPPGSPLAKPGDDGLPNVVGTVGVELALNSVPTVQGGQSKNVGSEMEVKKRRGRPRKYGINGNPLSPASAPSQLPNFSLGSSERRSRGRPRGSGRLQLLASIGGIVADSAGGCFTPYVVTVNIGEDVVKTILSFSQKNPRTICILSATGAVSSVIFRRPDNSGGVLRFEGLFEILSLSGSYTVGGPRRSGMLSVSLAKPDGRVFGGAVEGSLIAARPIQLILGSFKPNISKQIKRRHSAVSCAPPKMAGHPEMEEGKQDGPVSTSNGSSDNVNPTRDRIPDDVVPPTASSNGTNINMDSQHMASADHQVSTGIRISDRQI